MSTVDIADLEEAVQKWAWNSYELTTVKCKRIKFDDVRLEVKWDKVDFSSSVPTYKKTVRSEVPISQVVFRSTYENHTDSNQEQSFTTERSTVSTCSTSISKGFTKGASLELKLSLPSELLEVTTGFGREVTVEKVAERTSEESLTWTANSTIHVSPKRQAIAELVVKENELQTEFAMDVKIRGKILVVITNLKDNNSFVQSVEGNVAKVLWKEFASNENVSKEEDGNILCWKISGKCHFRYGIEQRIHIDEKPLKPRERPEPNL